MARFAALGVTASVQPEHAMDDRDVAEGSSGPAARPAPSRWAELRAAGVPLSLGSDAPVAPLDPWTALAAAVTRSRDGRAPWHPEQRIDTRAALEASVDGRPLGLAVGGPADLALLDADPLAARPDDEDAGALADALRATHVAGTIVAGRWTHHALGG